MAALNIKFSNKIVSVWLVIYTVIYKISFRLKKAGIKVKFVTNTTKEPLRTLHEKLTSLGFEIDRSEIFTSLSAARQLVERKQVRPFLLLEESAKEDFKGLLYDHCDMCICDSIIVTL